MNLKPLGDRVIVKADEAEETTASGLFIASEAKKSLRAASFWQSALASPIRTATWFPFP